MATLLNTASSAVVEKHEAPLRDVVQNVVEGHMRVLSGQKISNLYDVVIGEMEQVLIEKVLDYTGGNESRSAKILGISRGTLRQRRKVYGHYEHEGF